MNHSNNYSYIFLFSCLFLFPLHATFGASYKTCTVAIGDIAVCYAPYSGNMVILQNGSYQTCKISVGNIAICYAPYSGDAVILKNASYQKCKISIGNIAVCYKPYSGKTVILQ